MKYINEEQFKELEDRVSAIEKKINTNSVKISRKPQSMVEFLKEKKPKTEDDCVLCVAYFIEGKADEVTSGNIKNYLKKAHSEIPSNVPRSLAKCARKGFIQEDEKKDKKSDNKIFWILTTTGIEYVKKLNKE